MKELLKLAGLQLLWLLPYIGHGQDRNWAVSIAGGAVHNFRSALKVTQQDAETTRLQAHYRTEPFKPPVYYDVRVSTWQQDKGWELKFTHHKLILDNNPPEIQRFSITDGYNLLTLNRLWFTKHLILSAGTGLVITHPESTIRNQAYPENKGLFNKGYYVSGPAVELAAIKQVYFSGNWFVLGEGRFSYSYVKVPVVNGNAYVSNPALHALFGVGFRISGDESNGVSVKED